MILTGRAVSAQEAHQWGLVNEIVPRGTHLQRAVALGQALAQFPQAAMLNDRRSVYAAFGKEAAHALRTEAQFGMTTLRSGEAQRGADTFTTGKGRGGEF